MIKHEQYNLKDTSISPLIGDFISSPNVARTDKTFNIKNFYIFNDTEFEAKRGQKFRRTAFSTLLSGSVYSAAASDYLIGVTSLSYAPSIGLPSPKLVGEGKSYIVKDEAGGAGATTITIRSAAEETIDGASTSTLTVNYQAKKFYTDGAVWFTN